MSLLARLFQWVFPTVPSSATETGLAQRVETAGVRLHVPRSIMHALRSATLPTRALPEPLVLLHVRFASEEQLDTVVAIGAMPFPIHAYVEGFAGANFDTTWVVDAANASIVKNAGVFLVHSHGGTGVPRFSVVDEKTNRSIMAMLSAGITTAPYGAMVMSRSAATAVLARVGGLAEMRVVEVPDALGRFEMTV